MTDLVFERGMPMSLDSERLVLGAALETPGVFEHVKGFLDASHFALEAHRRVFKAADGIISGGGRLDRVTLAQTLLDSGRLESVGGLTYLCELTDMMPIIPNIDDYIRIVLAMAIKRRAIFLAQETMERAFDGSVTAEELTATAESKFRELAREGTGPSRWRSIGQVAEQHPGGIETLLAWRKHTRGILTPWERLNLMTGGLRRGDLIVVAGAPSQGKSAAVYQLAQYVAQQKDKTTGEENAVAIITLESSEESIYARMVAQDARVDATAMSWGTLDADGRRRAMDACRKLSALPIYFDTANSCTPAAIRSRVTALVRDHNLALVIADNLSLMKNAAETRNLEIAGITRELKLLARDLKIPFVLLVHLTKDVGKRPDPKPTRADLRDSGAIDQDADLITFLYRPEVYAKNQPELAGAAELILAKQREGPIGTINMIWRPDFQRFDEVSNW